MFKSLSFSLSPPYVYLATARVSLLGESSCLDSQGSWGARTSAIGRLRCVRTPHAKWHSCQLQWRVLDILVLQVRLPSACTGELLGHMISECLVYSRPWRGRTIAGIRKRLDPNSRSVMDKEYRAGNHVENTRSVNTTQCILLLLFSITLI